MKYKNIKIKSINELMIEFEIIRNELLNKRKEIEMRINKLRILIESQNICETIKSAYKDKIMNLITVRDNINFNIERIRLLKIKQADFYNYIEYNQKRVNEVGKHYTVYFYNRNIKRSIENINNIENEINKIRQKILNV